MANHSPITRRPSRQIMVGNVPVGGDAPIAVQSMTNTETCDVSATVNQVNDIAGAGADMVRVSVPAWKLQKRLGRLGGSFSPANCRYTF